jgi:hypothetical protein
MGVAPSCVCAEWKDFAPTPFENGAYLDTFASWERDNLHAGNASSRWNDTFIREKVTLFSDGYSYHPRFLQYHFSIGGALRQENYDSSLTGSTGWTDGTGLEYDLRLVFLPEHTYNLSVFASRYEPLFKEQSASQHTSVGTTYGTSFRYRKKPYFVHAGVVTDNIDNGVSSSDVTRVALDGEYLKRFGDGYETSVNAGFNPSWFSSSTGLSGNQTEYTFGNVLNLQTVRLTSNFSKNDFHQDTATAESFESDQLSWYELLNAYLPYNFRSDLSYRFRDNNDTIESPATPVTKLSDQGDDLEFNLAHRLYESVETTYTFLRDSHSSSGGDTTSLSNSLTLSYAKRLPRDSRLLVGFGVARTDTDNTGQATVLNQAFPGVAIPPGLLTLPQQNVDASTILVFLQSPLPPFQLILLTENVDYRLIGAVGSTFQIQIISLPPQFVLPGTYSFSVSYSLTSGDFSLQTDSVSGNASTQLFNDLLTPYFNYVHITSKVLSGFFPGVPLDSTTYVTGLIVHRGPVRLLGEYEDFEWNVSPYHAWRVEAQYISSLGPTTNVYATAAYLNKYYPHGSSGSLTGTVSAMAAYTEQSESGAASIQQQLPAWNMYLSAGGSYSHLHGFVDTNAYAFNASWAWRVGRIDLSVGASAYESDSSGAGTVPTRRDHELVYVNLRRRIF